MMSDDSAALDPELMRGSLDLMVLSALSDGPLYGYLIQQRLRDRSRERVEIQAGTLYPILHRLEASKFVRSRWDDSTGRRRKWYELTAAGRRRLAVRVREWQDYVACLKEILNVPLDVGLSPEGSA